MENVSTSESKRTSFFGGGFRRGQSEHMAGFELATTAVGGIASHTLITAPAPRASPPHVRQQSPQEV